MNQKRRSLSTLVPLFLGLLSLPGRCISHPARLPDSIPVLASPSIYLHLSSPSGITLSRACPSPPPASLHFPEFSDPTQPGQSLTLPCPSSSLTPGPTSVCPQLSAFTSWPLIGAGQTFRKRSSMRDAAPLLNVNPILRDETR